MDTRVGLGWPVALGPGDTASFQVTGRAGVPDSGVGAVAVNVTVVAPTNATHVTVWAAGSGLPSSSTVNASAGTDVANFAMVGVGSGGQLSARNDSGFAHLVVDVVGWFDSLDAGHVHPLPPVRLIDTREASGPLGPAAIMGVAVSGRGGVPARGVRSVLVNLTGVNPTDPTHLVAWPSGSSRPETSNLNLAAGTTRANVDLVTPGPDGAVLIANNAGKVDVVVDVLGWVDDGGSTGGLFDPVTPARVVDTRTGQGGVGRLGPGETVEVALAGGGAIPGSGVAAVVANITGVAASGSTHLSVWSSGTDPPPTSVLNLSTGETVANLVLVPPGLSGKISIRNNAASVDLVIDVEGYVTAGVDLDESVAANANRCDPIAPSLCLLPFPNDWFTSPDPSTSTGRRVQIDARSTPVNATGVPIDPAEWNRSDGFSPGSGAIVHIPGVDLAASGAPPVTDIASSLAAGSPVVLLDATTGERYPFWVELDSRATSDTTRMVVITPARALTEGHRFIVALRDLLDSSHRPIAPTAAFRALRDRLVTAAPSVEARREHFEDLFEHLAGAGLDRAGLTLAWDFTVASKRSLSERVLHIRDESFAMLGGSAPAFWVTSVEQNVNDHIARRVHGIVYVPNYLTGDGSAGQQFNLGPDGLPEVNWFYPAPFQCDVPYAALGPGGGASPGPVVAARPVVYGHGLLGDESEIDAGNVQAMINEHNMIYCATRWLGLSSEDILNAAGVLQEVSRMPTIADRLQQAMLDTLWLGRVMRHPNGFSTDPAFRGPGGEPLLDTSELFYDGNSEGGIMGGATTAVSQEWQRAVLGVPGMDYGIMLPRSKDFATFAVIFDSSYTNELERGLVLDMVQMLWDRGESDGYAQHLTRDPYSNTPGHEVLLHEAFGDFQVPNVSTEYEARTIGAKVHVPVLAAGRSTDVAPFWGIDPIPAYPFDGSAIVMWDSGTPAPPTQNLPPSDGLDSHEDPRAMATAREQKSEFLKTGGGVIDVCSASPCLAVHSDG